MESLIKKSKIIILLLISDSTPSVYLDFVTMTVLRHPTVLLQSVRKNGPGYKWYENQINKMKAHLLTVWLSSKLGFFQNSDSQQSKK